MSLHHFWLGNQCLLDTFLKILLSANFSSLMFSFPHKAWCITSYTYVPSLHPPETAWSVFLSFARWFLWKPFKCPLVPETHSKFTAQYSNHEYLMDPVIAMKWMWMCCWYFPVGIGTSHKQHAFKPENRNHLMKGR